MSAFAMPEIGVPERADENVVRHVIDRSASAL